MTNDIDVGQPLWPTQETPDDNHDQARDPDRPDEDAGRGPGHRAQPLAPRHPAVDLRAIRATR